MPLITCPKPSNKNLRRSYKINSFYLNNDLLKSGYGCLMFVLLPLTNTFFFPANRYLVQFFMLRLKKVKLIPMMPDMDYGL